MKKTILFCVSLLIATITSSAQCSMVPLSLNNRVNNSSLIVEGKVVAQRSFWNNNHNYIYTSNLVDVYKLFKGVTMVTQIEIITEGGEIDMQRQIVEPSLQLKVDDIGVFALNNFTGSSTFGKPTYTAYADAQGFIKYNEQSGSASDPFEFYPTISNDLHPLIEQITGKKFIPVALPSSASNKNGTTVSITAAVTGIAPTTITAGTYSVLTISGNGFGVTQAANSYVEFKNADDGGATYIQPHASQYTSWSNTQIKVMVPTKASTLCGTAGTGQVRVTIAGSSTLSAQTLTISYGHLNAGYTGTVVPVQVQNTRHHSLNGAGGITWRMYTGFDANAPAKASFLRALQSWRCATYINWLTGPTTTVNTIAGDGIQVVRFDVGSELPAGVLGRCTSYWNGCFTGTVVSFFVSELDIVFDDATNWQFGPTNATGTQYDFESVTVHELGHGHQLSHVINTADVMHYSIANAQNKRSLNVDDVNGGTTVMTRNLSGAVCGQTIMTALNATNCVLSVPTASFNVTTPVCVNQTVTLNDLSTGGPLSWAWTMPGGTPATSTLQNTSTTYTAPGTYSITLLAANGTGTSTPLTKTISVLATPTVNVAGTTTLCSGNTTTLTASGASTYTWMPGNLTGSVQALNPGTTTTYTVTGSNGACTSTKTVSVNVTSTPTVAATSATICSGNTATLTASGATTYTWMPGAFTGSAQTLSPSTTTSYTITGANGSCTSTKTTQIVVNATPTLNVAGTGTICSGSSITCTLTGALTYTWMPGGMTGAIATLSPGSTTVYTVTGSNGSCSSSLIFTITVNPSPNLGANSSTICAGQNAVLTATGATTYTWNPGNLSGPTQTFSPASTTVYTVTGTVGSCTASITRTVTVNPNPTITISGTGTICSGNTTSLTASGASSYTWTPGTLIGAAQTFTPSTTTVYTVTGSNGCSSVKNFTVTVNPSPTLAASSATICKGSSTTLTITGASTYTWNPGGLTGASQVLSPTVTTVYSVTGSNGTCPNTTTTSITVNSATVTASSNSPVCVGGTLLLFGSGAATYTWVGPSAFVSSIQNPTITNVTMANAGNYSLTITASNSCTAGMLVPVTINAAPTISVASSASSICSGQSTTLTSTGALSYTYSPGTLTTNPIVVSPTVTTTYSVLGMSSLGCTGTDTISVSVSPCTGIAMIGATPEFKVYPNPAQNIINIEFGENYTGKVYVYNVIGQELISKTIKDAESTRMDISDFSKGIYIVTVHSSNGKEKTIKIIRE